jgi:hypothetical protein
MRIVIGVTLRDSGGKKIGHLAEGSAYKVAGGFNHGLESGSVRRWAGGTLICRRIEDYGAVGEEIESFRGPGTRGEFGLETGECGWGEALKEMERGDLLCDLGVGLV